MNKPITMKYAELKQAMANVINQAGLPAFIVECVLREYLDEVKNMVDMQYFEDQQRYEDALKAEMREAEKQEGDADVALE